MFLKISISFTHKSFRCVNRLLKGTAENDKIKLDVFAYATFLKSFKGTFT